MSIVHQTTRGWSLDYRDEYDRRHRVPFPTEEQARTHGRFLDQEVKRRKAAILTATTAPEITVAQALQLYLSARVICASTRTRLRGQLARFLQRLGSQPVTEVTPQLILTHFQARATELAPSTLCQEQYNVRALFRFLVEALILPANPAQALRPRHPRYSAGIALTYEQEALLLAVSYPQAALRFLLALDAGLRIGEIPGLRRNHVNLGQQTLTVWAPKTYRTRVLPITDRLTAVIADRLDSTTSPDAPLIQKPGGHALKYPSHFIRHVRWQLPFTFRFHDLRHTYATRLAQAGAGFGVVAFLLGHAPSNSTLAYIHPGIDELTTAVARMEAANPNCQGEPHVPPR